jgi:hypothetical protein
MRKVILIYIIVSQISCFDFSKSKSYDIGDGFDYGYYNNDIKLSNIYYRSGGIFPYQCINVRWNDNLIYVECKDRKNDEIFHFIIDKAKYKLQPRQFESIGIKGPLNYDSLLKSTFFQNKEMGKNILTTNDMK